MIGTRIRFRARDGKRVTALAYETRSDLPVFDVELVDDDGEVVEYIDPVLGYYALENLAARRGWSAA